MSMTYDFVEQMKEGEQEELALDSFWGRWFDIEIAPRWLQKLGVDRIWTSESGRRWTVEYKADEAASRTGNAFIETVSVDSSGTLGWAYTSCAQLFVHYIPSLGEIRVLPMTLIKRHLPAWEAKFRESPPVPNIGRNGDTYNTFGVLVPLSELDKFLYVKLEYKLSSSTG